MLYLTKLPLVGHNDDTREEALRSLAEKLAEIGCEIRAANSDRYIIRNPFLSMKPLGRLSFLATIDKIQIDALEDCVKVRILSIYRFTFLTIVALAISFNIVDRLDYEDSDFMKAGLTGAIAIILATMIFYVNALRAKRFARKALRSA